VGNDEYLWMSLVGLSMSFLIFIFYLINLGGHLNRFGKDFIYCDLWADGVTIAESVTHLERTHTNQPL
jgi:hypothetical protein